MKNTNPIDNKLTEAQEHHSHLEKIHLSTHRMGIVTLALIFGLFGVWSVFAELETTITAQGKVISKSYNKIVMHPVGGIVKKLFIDEGAYVHRDQKLLELDSVTYQTQLASSITKHDRNLFSICKLKSEANLKEKLECIEYKKNIINKDNFKHLIIDVQTLFISDMQNLEAKINLLKSQNNVLRSRNNGLRKQIESNQRLLLSYKNELVKWNKLLKVDAVDELKTIETQRRIEQSYLQIGSLQSSIEENLATIKAHEQEIFLEKESFKNRALVKGNELELDNKLIYDNIIALKNTIENSTIKSPSDGLITDMKIHASREVVSPQKPIMSIVPDETDLMVEAYVLPTDIEKIYKGQKTEVSFPAFIDPSAIPIEGELTYISADAIIPENTQESVYRVLVKITPKGFEAIKNNNFKIMPGMPSAVFIQIGHKTLLEYLMSPVIQMFKGIYNAN